MGVGVGGLLGFNKQQLPVHRARLGPAGQSRPQESVFTQSLLTSTDAARPRWAGNMACRALAAFRPTRWCFLPGESGSAWQQQTPTLHSAGWRLAPHKQGFHSEQVGGVASKQKGVAHMFSCTMV